MKKNIEIYCPTQGLAVDMVKFVARKLILKSEVIENKDGSYKVLVYNASDKEVNLIKKHRRFRGATIKVFGTIDASAEKVISGIDFIARDFAVPAIKATARVASGLASAGFKASVTAVGSILNAAADNYNRTKEDLKLDPEINTLFKRFRNDDVESEDVKVIDAN